ncbi:MAG: glycosyltransferase [Candidatus Limivivens sp.]|nr:glycosyltransferase [Candidatus Limivivens sp.]
MKKKISVVVPCLNGADFLPRCIESLLAQTFNELEIIIVNDGSTDETGEISKKYADEYSNITVLTKKNEGLPQARRSGLEIVNTPYVGFVDSDDWVEKNMFQMLFEQIENNNADVSCGGFFLDWTRRSETVRQCFETGTVLDKGEAVSHLHRRDAIHPYLWNKLYRIELFQKVNFPKGNFIGEDYATIIQVLERVQKIAIVQDPVYHYVQTHASMSRSGFCSNHVNAYQKYCENRRQMEKKYPECRAEIQNYMETEFLSFIVAMSRNKNYDKQIAKEITLFVRKNLMQYLSSSYIEGKFKVSALACAISYKVLAVLYSFDLWRSRQ